VSRHLAALIGLLLVAAPSWAHEVRPGYLELTQTAPDTFQAVWKVPSRGELRLALSPVFPEACTPSTEITRVRTPGAVVDRWTLTCDGGLEGELRIAGLQTTLTDVMVRIRWESGGTQTVLLQSTSPSVVIEGGGQSSTPVWGYLRLGVEHILLGIDHLLFVLGLLLIVKDRWMLIKTVTSFTVAHSITLGIATLGYASAPLAPLNAAIALSILFLGPEIVRSWRGQTSFTIRHPWVVAFAFGLLHGFGFASGLSTLGLPAAEIPVALLLFNVGVEVGQIGFVVLVLALERSFAVLEIRWPQWVEAAPGYAVGSLGAYWTIQRTAMLFPGFQ
jgi:hypothetical protein